MQRDPGVNKQKNWLIDWSVSWVPQLFYGPQTALTLTGDPLNKPQNMSRNIKFWIRILSTNMLIIMAIFMATSCMLPHIFFLLTLVGQFFGFLQQCLPQLGCCLFLQSLCHKSVYFALPRLVWGTNHLHIWRSNEQYFWFAGSHVIYYYTLHLLIWLNNNYIIFDTNCKILKNKCYSLIIRILSDLFLLFFQIFSFVSLLSWQQVTISYY